MRTSFGWCHNPAHGPYAHFQKSTCEAFTTTTALAPPVPERTRAS